MILNNPYYYHPQLATRQVADDVLFTIDHHSQWSKLFEQGKMLGILIIESPTMNAELSNALRVHILNNIYYLVAFSGVVNGLYDENHFFVPPVYDLQNPDDFYLQKDKEITDINHQLADTDGLSPKKIHQLKTIRKELSISLQKEIFSHFNFLDSSGTYKNVIDIFEDAKRGLPPGGTGECAAPRLLQYAYQHGLKPLQIAEFWYGQSPKNIQRIHGKLYPSCIEKCSPILKFMIPSLEDSIPASQTSMLKEEMKILYEDEYLLAIHKPAGLLSVPSKDYSQANVEAILHEMYSEVKGPMLIHRLDQATSGILIAAKDAQTFKMLCQLFVDKRIQKRYIARLAGKLKSECGIISLPLTVNPDDRPRQVVDFQFGKEAISYYEKIIGKWGEDEIDEDETLLMLYPLTGRTHQLRVHCASPFGLDHVIVGDTLYDIMDEHKKSAPRLMLHAERITFEHPYTKESIYIEDELS
ncbi:MAG: RluA family pseudouridine synthase [Bacteroidales bacterium]|nr:RluA family pseudouridine synthase [Bacteroidales bacterium]